MRKNTSCIAIALIALWAISLNLLAWDFSNITKAVDTFVNGQKVEEEVKQTAEAPAPPELAQPQALPATQAPAPIPAPPALAPIDVPSAATSPNLAAPAVISVPSANDTAAMAVPVVPPATQAIKNATADDLQAQLLKAASAMTGQAPAENLPAQPTLAKPAVETPPATTPDTKLDLAEVSTDLEEVPAEEEEVVEETEEEEEEVEVAIDITLPLPRQKRQNTTHQLALYRCYCQYVDPKAQKASDDALWTAEFKNATVKDEKTEEVSEVFTPREKGTLDAQQLLSARLEKALKK